MEFVGRPATSGACNFLGVPGPGCLDVDDDDSDVVIGIRPKSSPLPRRRSSATDDDLEIEPPPCGSRRVSFADAKGLSLVQVKKFDTWDLPLVPGFESSEGNGKDAEEFLLCPFNFTPPLSTEELVVKVQKQKVELESVELLPGTTILKGVIRVLNICFDKAVYVRTTLDAWSSNFDLLAEYIPGSSDGVMDSFSFKLTLVPPFGEQGARVDFCLRYETKVGTFWANNSNRNYVLFCYQKEKQQKEHLNKKSCLKTVSQNFSAVETPSQDMSTDGSKHGKEVDSKEINKISDGQSRTSEEDVQKLKTESRRNCSRRSRRKTARMAAVRDYFAQRDMGVNDSGRDASPPGAEEEEEEEEDKVEKHPDTPRRSVSDGNTPATHSKSSRDEDKPEKPECNDVSTSATLTNINLSHSEPVPEGGHSIDKSSSGAEAASLKPGVDHEASNTADETAIIISESSESPVSHTTSFTFGTVVAPLYPQVFARVRREGDDPVLAKMGVADLTKTYPHAERTKSSCTAAADMESNHGKFQEDVIKPQEYNQECSDATLNTDSLSTASNDSFHHDILHDTDGIPSSDQRATNTPQTSGDITNHPQSGNILSLGLFSVQIHREVSHLQGNAREDILTCDLQNQTGEEIELPERTCTHTKTVLDEALSRRETRDDTDSQQTSILSRQPPRSVSEHVSDDAGQRAGGGANSFDSEDEASKEENIGNTIKRSMINASPEKDNPAEAHDLDAGPVSVSKKEKGETLLENQEEINHTVDGNVHEGERHRSAESDVRDNPAESLTKAATSENLGCGDVFVELKGDAEVEATVSRQEDLSLAQIADVLNWEMMVEEEEKNILTDQEEGKGVNLSTGEAEEEPRELIEDTGVEKNEDTIEEECMVITAEGEKAVEVENRGEEMVETVLGKELKYIAEEEEIAEETKKIKRPEEEMIDFAEMQEVDNTGADIQDEDQIGGEEEMEIDLSDEDGVKPEKENIEEENPAYEEEMLAVEAGEVKLGDAESECTAMAERRGEMGRFEGRLDVAHNKIEDGLSAPLSNVREAADESVIAKENTGGGQHAHVPTGTHLREEEEPRSGKSAAHDPSEAARGKSDLTAARGGACVPTDEPERDPDSGSAESDSDDEVELYMHCLRAVHAGVQASRDQSQDTGLSANRRPAACRRRRLSAPMPSISESLDEEGVCCLQGKQEDTEPPDFQPAAAAPSASSGQEGVSRSTSWWRDTFSCSNISKTLLNITLLVVFSVVAYHYDFLACFGLYLITVVWLFCQGERQPGENNKIG